MLDTTLVRVHQQAAGGKGGQGSGAGTFSRWADHQGPHVLRHARQAVALHAHRRPAARQFTAKALLGGFKTEAVLADRAYAEQALAHKISGVREAIEKAGARLLFLSSYSPDFNPIQMVFSELKVLLRKAAARTLEQLCSVIPGCLSTFKPDECRHYVKAPRYDQQLSRK